MTRSAPVAAVVALLAVATVALFAEQAVLTTSVVPRNVGEGWNAFHAARAWSGEALYPDLGATTSNNYPPLSFYLVGWVAGGTGDAVLAGRAIAYASLVALVGCVGLVVRRLGGSGTAAAFAALLFAGTVATRFEHYVGIADPQWLAHAIMLAGLAVFLGRGGEGWRPVATAALMLVAGLVKHNLVALPLALCVWLFWCREPGRVRFVAASAALAAVALGALGAVYGEAFFAAVLAAPRVYDGATVALKLDAWLTPLVPLVAGWLALVAIDRSGRETRLVSLYAVFSAVFGAAISGGAGVGYNAYFDLVIALVLAAGLLVDRLAASARSAGAPQPVGRAGAMLLLSLAVLVASPAGLLKGWWAIERRADDETAVAAELAFLARHEGPAICEELALCYWAGKSFDMDLFNTGQKLRTGALSDDAVVPLFEEQRFAVIQIDSPDGRTARLPSGINDAIHEHYRVARRSRSGAFLVPRSSR